MHSVRQHFFRWIRWKHAVFSLLLVAFFGSAAILQSRFYRENTFLVPQEGGTYIEGAIGEFRPLNPWFVLTNDVNRDMVSLIFTGLLRYNPHTKDIEEDLALLDVSSDGKIYTVKLKENIFWHDSTKEHLHPVTSDDILFTFKTIQNPDFPNTLLQQNFRGVEIVQIDERTVQFRLEESYSFFPSNLTLGLLPRRSFEGIPVNRLSEVFDFGFHPIGTGPYRFKSLIQTELSTEITLEHFIQPASSEIHHLERMVFRVFPNFRTLLSDVGNLDGIRLVPREDDGTFMMPRRFDVLTYSLPQYTALFFNLDHPVLRDPKLRLGLQLGTNKEEIAHIAGSSLIVDTPFLELDTSDWRYQFDASAAQGALFDSEWYFPEKLRLQRLLEEQEANRVGMLQMDPIVLLDTGAIVTITGAFLKGKTGLTLNDVLVEQSSTGSWTAFVPTDGSTGSLTLGTNLLRLRDAKGAIIDSFYLWRTTDPRAFRRASLEQKLVTDFLAVRSSEKHLTAMDFFLEDGHLRSRRDQDPLGTRINEKGELLDMVLLTSPSLPVYRDIAENIVKQWKELGVLIKIDIPDTREQFEERLLARDYDVVLFGQSLLNNLDTYPYWHSSAVQRTQGKKSDLRLDAYNLSQYASFEVDALLEVIRSFVATKEREDALLELRDALKKDIPAVFLYSPEYAYAYRHDVKGIDFGTPALHSDRFLTVANWYLKQERVFSDGKSWWSFFPWILSLLS
ncbi:hypothetical protein A3D11_04490 [Candidatus Peribacteria bacterium RIFCSPHIGHO2_02_FULL_49_16]|nr:MAG: hypothetical protein A2880_04055 [Candidatus Peribacteria bacterium RIFCSPHIGHO2_01_FULL_49_38]OGJ58960.1 MAG: hypothetical protein A3D11_04490 [Candidatus Peribacteria bacterium RIFCSPHIGHO2_02_FULL_49_16]